MSYQINDAVLIPWGHHKVLTRVRAITMEGDPVVKYSGYWITQDPSKPMTYLGRFKRKWLRWKFIPNKDGQ